MISVGVVGCGPLMGRLCETEGLNEDQSEILNAVRTFVEERILPGSWLTAV